MGKTSKRTKKFQKNNLKTTIKKRHEIKDKKKLYDRREASKQKRIQDRLARKEQLSAQRQREEDELNDIETFSDDDNANLEQDVEDFLEKLTNGDIDMENDSDDDDFSDTSFDNNNIINNNDNNDDQNLSLRKEVEEHKTELEKLKENDPKFYEFLKENDAELLNFNEDLNDLDDDLDSNDEIDDMDEDIEGYNKDLDKYDDDSDSNNDDNNKFMIKNKKKQQKKHIKQNSIQLTINLVDDLIKNVSKTQSTKDMKKLIIAYKCGCHFNEGEDINNELPFYITNSDVYNHLMITGIVEFPILFHNLFEITESHKTEELKYQKSSKKQKTKQKFTRLQTRITKHERWNKLQSCIKSYLKSTIFLLDKMTDPKITAFILRRVNQDILVYFSCIPYIANKLLRVLNRYWSESDETSRILAFIAIRELTILSPYPFIDNALKSSYLTFVKNAKFTNRAVLGTIQFMSNCVVELFGLDFKSSYQHAFSHIRVLAVKLRNAIISKTQEHFSMIHSWQYYHSLNLWTEVLCTYADQVDLQLLVYPLVQVISGVLQLLPIQRYYPFHFLCIRLLHRLARATKLFIPTLPFLLRILDSTEFRKRFKPSTQKPLDWTCTLKVQNALLHTRVLFDGIVEQLFELLLEHFAIYAYSISFPELAVPSIVSLKKFIKQCKVPEYCKIFRQLVQQLDNGTTFIRSHRLKVDFAPKDVDKADQFLNEKKQQDKHPLIKFYNEQKHYREKSAEQNTKQDVFEMDEDISE